MYNSADLPASPFRTDVWKSGYVYSAFASTCPASSDASLISIRANGAKLLDFNSEKLYYDLKSTEIQQVSAYSNSPFAIVSTDQATIQNGRKAKITVQAEDKSVRMYEVHFDNQTATMEIFNDGFKITQQSKKLIVDANSEINGTFKIYNSLGQNIHTRHIFGNTNNQFSINDVGIYLALCNTFGIDYAFKFIIK